MSLTRAVIPSRCTEGGSDLAERSRTSGTRAAPADNFSDVQEHAMKSKIVEQGPTVEPRYLDVDTAARYLCMSRHALYHRVSRRQIPFARQGWVLRFDRVALDRWMSKGVRHGFDEARRPLVLQENDQRAAVHRVDRLRGSQVG